MEIEPISNIHYRHIVTLYRRCFHIKTTVKKIAEKYGKAIGYIALDNGRPAAYYGVFHHSIAGRLSAQSGDTMTDPDYQGKGLFIKLARLTYSKAEELGYEMIFGFPNENSLPGFQKYLNWEFTDTMQLFKIKTGNFPLCEIIGRLPYFQPLYDRFTGGVQRINRNGNEMQVKPKGHLYIGYNNLPADQLINEAKRLARKWMCGNVIIGCSKSHPMHERLTPYIQPVEGLPIGFLKFKDIDTSAIRFTLSDADTWKY